MKVVIDMIEDMREGIGSDGTFMLWAMGLKEESAGSYLPSWQSPISHFEVDLEQGKVFLFLGKTALDVQSMAAAFNAMENSQMMYELQLSYSREGKRVDSPLIGFGENLEEKKYLLFLAE